MCYVVHVFVHWSQVDDSADAAERALRQRLERTRASLSALGAQRTVIDARLRALHAGTLSDAIVEEARDAALRTSSGPLSAVASAADVIASHRDVTLLLVAKRYLSIAADAKRLLGVVEARCESLTALLTRAAAVDACASARCASVLAALDAPLVALIAHCRQLRDAAVRVVALQGAAPRLVAALRDAARRALALARRTLTKFVTRRSSTKLKCIV